MANFFVKTVTGSMLYQPVSQWHSLHFELLIELVAQKLTELWRFKNLAYFFTWWPSSMTYLFVNVTYWNCSPILYVDQVWWWYVKAFMSYAWQNWQTNRQTDRQTNRQTNILAKNCKFWQVTTASHPYVAPRYASADLCLSHIQPRAPYDFITRTISCPQGRVKRP